MLKELRFVLGSVSRKDLVPGMTHFVIENGVVRGYNGVIALSSPIPFDIDCKPKAVDLVKAVLSFERDDGEVPPSMTMTPNGKLRLAKGPIRHLINCVNEETPHVLPEGEWMKFNGAELLEAAKALAPFIGSDASRPWSNGILLRGDKAYATNNVILVEYQLSATVPRTVNIPELAVKELIRNNQAPAYAQVGTHSITFYQEQHKWLRSQLFDTEWPDLKRLLDKIPEALPPVREELFIGLEKIKAFTDGAGRVYIHQGILSTSDQPKDEGSTYSIDNWPIDGLYAYDKLKLLDGVVGSIDFSLYPEQCPFIGIDKKLRGVIIGMRQAIK
jgi:hypothetical protein